MKIKEYKINFIKSLLPFYDEMEAESFFYLILENQRQLRRIDLALNIDLLFSKEEILIWNAILEKLQLEIPIQYILGTTHFYGLEFIDNINYITLTVQSGIKNTLLYEDTQIELDPECVNVIKIKTTGKKTFEVKLSDAYIVNGDDRVLGIKITRIMIDQDVIF